MNIQLHAVLTLLVDIAVQEVEQGGVDWNDLAQEGTGGRLL